MKIWVVMKGEMNEGGHIEAAYATEASAKAHFEASLKKLIEMWSRIYEHRPDYIKDRTNIEPQWASVACDTIQYFEMEVLP